MSTSLRTLEGRGGENGKVICENRSYGYGISSELLST